MTNHTTATYDALVDLTRSLRPTWHVEGIRNAIRQTLARPEATPLPDLAYALVRIASDPTVTTPAVLAMEGPHWRHAGSTEAFGSRIAVKGRCESCGGMHATDAPHQATEDAPAHHHDPRAAAARAQLAQAKTALCPCGVLPRDCDDHAPNRPTEGDADA